MQVDYVRMYELTGRPYRTPVPPVLTKEPLPANAQQPLPDGNLLYNGNFDRDDPNVPNLNNVPDTDYWTLYQGEGGAGSVSLDSVAGSSFAKMSIASGGSQPYSVQLLNTISIGKGRFYKMSFDAKAAAARNLMFRVTGGASRGYSAYSPSSTVALTDQVQHYELSFQMKQDTDIAARTEFNAGLNTNAVWIGHVRVEEIDGIPFDDDVAKTPLDGDGNRVWNGTFELGRQDRMTYWHVTTTGGAAATAAVSESDRYLNVAVTGAGSVSSSDVNVLQKGISMLGGQTYQVSWNGRADTARAVDVELLSGDGATSYGKQTVQLDTVDLASAASLRTASFTMPAAVTDNNAQLVFHIGGSVGTIAMDNVALVQTSVYIDPSVKLFPLMNGDFDTGTLLPWQEINVDGYAAAAVTNGEAKISVSANEGTVPWGVLFMQDGLSVAKGVTYTLEFDARATVNRQIEFDLEDSSYTRYFDQKVNLNGTMQHFAYEFKSAKDVTAALKFMLGRMDGAAAIGTAHDVFIDGVSLRVKGAEQLANKLTNGTFDGGVNGWSSYFADFDGVTGGLSAADGELKASLNQSGSQNWSAQVMQNGLALEQGKSYRLTFDARSTLPRTIQALIEHNGDAYTKYAVKTVALTTQKQTFSTTFTMPAGDSNVHLDFLLGAVDGPVTAAHDVILDNVSLVEVDMPAAPPAQGHALLNGTFDTNVDNWSTYLADGSNAVVSAVYGQMQVKFPNYDGWEKWSTQVYQTGLQLDAGVTYELKFDVSAAPSKDIKVEILRGDGTAHLLEQQQLTPTATMHTYTYDFTVTGASEPNAKLAFLLGGNHLDGSLFPVGSTINLDNICIGAKVGAGAGGG
jgi:hypothetical protein